MYVLHTFSLQGDEVPNAGGFQQDRRHILQYLGPDEEKSSQLVFEVSAECSVLWVVIAEVREMG